MKAAPASPYLLSGGGAVIHQHQGGEDVGDEPDDGDEIGSDPDGHTGHQPLPVALHDGLQQGAAGTTVPVLIQPLQLVPGQGRRGQLDQLAEDTSSSLSPSSRGRPADSVHVPVRVPAPEPRRSVPAHRELPTGYRVLAVGPPAGQLDRLHSAVADRSFNQTKNRAYTDVPIPDMLYLPTL